MPADLYSSYIFLASAFVKRPSCLTCRISLIVKFMFCLLFVIFYPSQQKGINRKNSDTQPLRDKADTTFHYDKDYIDDSGAALHMPE